MSSANTMINKAFPGSGVCAVVLAALMLLSSCENNLKSTPTLVQGSRQVPEEGEKIESYLSGGAKVKGKLTSPYMLRYHKADTLYSEFPRSQHVDFYTDSHQVESQKDAKYGK